MLGLEKPPRRIEGYDISHQSGENTVGSMVVFVNGVADRSEYRKFKLRTSTNDDLKSMKEVLSRRLKHTEWEYPDLIILDEPFSGLDPVSVEYFKRLILELKKQGRTIIFSSHIMSHVEMLCEDIVIIDNGKVLLSGDLNEIKNEYSSKTLDITGDISEDVLKQISIFGKI